MKKLILALLVASVNIGAQEPQVKRIETPETIIYKIKKDVANSKKELRIFMGTKRQELRKATFNKTTKLFAFYICIKENMTAENSITRRTTKSHLSGKDAQNHFEWLKQDYETQEQNKSKLATAETPQEISSQNS
jgi:hypothetical protein